MGSVVNACSSSSETPLDKALASSDERIRRVMDDVDTYELQILYTQIDRSKQEVPELTTYSYQVDSTQYFYPASTVKFPIAILALEQLINRSIGDTMITLDTPYRIENDSVVSSVRKDVNAIFAVSDNAAYNRLFEWLGQDTINKRLEELGIGPVRIAHRLSTANSDRLESAAILVYPHCDTLPCAEETAIRLPGYTSKPIEPLRLDGLQKGVGYLDEGERVEAPFNFTYKNYFPIRSQEALMRRVIFPDQYEGRQGLQLDDETFLFLYGAMQKLPRAQGYDPEEYYDSYGKFFIYGDTQERIPNNLKIFNKVGYAYGTLTDVAYIADIENDIEFLLTATLLVNPNNVFNDDNYAYEDIGIPFLAQLGRELYAQELEAARNASDIIEE
ncbi:serine hydrolase [Croceiramulus getboli]|nr:serine hydrolase [Flavobacteriaceae bacterium YJPT1-3]